MFRVNMPAIYCLVLYSILPAIVRGDSVVHCAQVAKIDCANGYKPEGNETVCCSDLQVYPNFCFFAQQKCQDPTLTVLYLGNCVNTTPKHVSHNPVTVSGPSIDPPTADPSNILSSVFCANKDQIDCSDDLDPVCGTDNTFYQNACDFAKARCENDSLSMQDLSVCKTALRIKRELRFV